MRHEPPDDEQSQGGRPDDEELDRLLAQARWPEPSAEQIERLTAGWEWMQPVGHRRAWRFVASGLAAAVMLLAAFVLRERILMEANVAVRPENTSPLRPAAAEPSGPPVAAELPSEVPSTSREVRGPNTFELVVLAGHARRREAKETKGNTRVTWRQRLVGEMCQALTDDPTADVRTQLGEFRGQYARIERLAWPIARNRSDPRQLGAMRLLAVAGTRHSAPVLTELAGEPALHETATRALARLASDGELVGLIQNEADAGARQELMTLLVDRRTPVALEAYLALVSDPASRDEALAALAAAPVTGADALSAYLNDPRQSVRLTASYALSTLDDPRAAELLGRSLGGIGRQESLMGLLASRSSRADELVAMLRRSPNLLGSLQAAEQQLRTLQTQSGENLP